MKSFIYNLLSKGLLLAVLVAIAAGYYYRASLFPKWFGEDAPVVETAPAPSQEAAEVATTDETREDTAATTPVQIPPVAAAPEEIGKPDDGVAATPAEADTVTEMSTVMVTPLAESSAEGEAPADSAAIAQAPAAVIGSQPLEPVTAADEPAPQKIEPAVELVAPDAPVAPPASNTAASLAEARRAYWDNDLEAAVSAYRAAIAADPDNPDAYGELGNLYFARGDWDAASQAYLDAGLRLIARGRPEAATGLLRVIGRLDPVRARQLARELYMVRTGGESPPQ